MITLAFYYVIFITKNWKILKFASKENGFAIPILPLIGNTYIILLTIQKLSLISALQWYEKNIGYPCGIWDGLQYMYISNNPSEIKIVLNHPLCYDKATMYKTLKFLFRSSLVLVPHKIWKIHRREYIKSYKPNVLRSFLPVFSQQSCKLLEEIRNSKGDLQMIFSKYAFTIFFRTSIGLREHEEFDNTERFCELTNLVQDELLTLMIDPITPREVWYKFYPAGRKAQKLIKEVDDIIAQIIKAKRKQHTDTLENSQNDDCLYASMDLMMDMTDTRSFGDIINFTTAASDTTGNSIMFTFTLLGMNPEIQDVLYNEVISVAGLNNEISYDHLSDLKYTEAVICESLRLLPTTPHIGRRINCEVDLGTKVLPEGIDFIVDIFHLHRDSRIWTDPLKFDPTRFLPENVSKIQPYTYLPFSSGYRDCIAKRQAMLLLKITVANVIRKFTITSKYKTVNDISVTTCIAMRSTHPLDCHFIPR